MRMQSALRLLYPPQCLNCRALVESDHALCAACWRDTPFITGLVCDACGTPLPGEPGAEAVHCDDCLQIPRPWARGRAALTYDDNARRLVLGLKHGDRLDLVRPAAGWMARAGGGLLDADALVVPVPLHWSRLLRRRYNQAALLARALAAQSGLRCCPDLLGRRRRTASQDGRDREARFRNLDAAIAPHPRRAHLLRGARILLIDDVMTSGATLTAASAACLDGGARSVDMLVLARVAKLP